MKYLFKTQTTMKDYNNNKYWVDRDIIDDITIQASDLKEALETYKNYVYNSNYITVSNNAIKNKNNMYIDLKDGTSKQTGYVLTASMDIDTNRGYTKQFIDLWIEILKIENINFEEVE